MRCLPLLMGLAVGTLGKVSYEGHRVLRVGVDSEAKRDVLRGEMENMDFWGEPVLGRKVDVRVSGEGLEAAVEFLRRHNMTYTVETDNVEELFAAQTANRKGYAKGQPLENFDYFEYHTYDEIIDWMHEMRRHYGHLVTLVNMGSSYEGRELLAMRVTGSESKTSKAKPKIFTNYAIHAREWLSPATGIYMIYQMLDQYEISGEIKYLVDSIEWTFLPVTNPDGYVYTWTNDRMWRKTRSPNAGSSCIGTDPNRNWGYAWGGPGASTNPCSESYMGSKAFSEIEVQTVADYLGTLGHKGYIDFHCCGEMWMSPWSYTTELPPASDYHHQMTANEQCTNAIKAVYGTVYAYGPISRVIYVASGSSVDYAYGELGDRYSFAVELPGSFTSPATIIRPTGIETFAALKEFGFVILNDPTA
eukprot:TRINITY_DN24396_c0_g1_i1.p1 TRINITY_DN24396_c0_g1~~TRINITY_DN24396_c0_g1_i1.p1  ORF type:complete len:433 (+),score=118.83 TRINITY_DN24396_c0_g1_i1:50-1300(+)